MKWQIVFRIVHYAVIDGNTSPIDLTQFTTKEGTHFVAIDADYVTIVFRVSFVGVSTRTSPYSMYENH